MRRPEYLGPAAASTAEVRAAASRRTGLGLIGLVEAGGRFVIQYPAYLLLVGAFDVLEYFLPTYLVTNLLYLGRAGLSVLLRLGRPAPRTPRNSDAAPAASAALSTERAGE
jgi:hypothetical protein